MPEPAGAVPGYDALVLQGGASHALFTLGFLQAAAPALRAVTQIAAVSSGAAVACAHLLGLHEEALERFLSHVRGSRGNFTLRRLLRAERPTPHHALYRAVLAELLAPSRFAALKHIPLADLERIEALTERAIARRVHPLMVDLEEEDPEAALHELRRDLLSRLPAPPPAPAYYEASADGEHYRALLLWRPLAGVGSDQQAVQAVTASVAAAPAERCGAVRLQLGGQLVVALEEQAAVRHDLTLASSFCMLLVLLAIYLHFRRVLLVLLLGVPALLAVLLALGLASVTVGELNMNSAFLMSIILGNGINPGILVLSRYREERLLGRDQKEALVQALLLTLRGTGAAMAAASIAYGCLALTSFRGFSQFGLLGGAGMFLSWLCTLVMLPPLILVCERRAPAHMQARPSLYHRPFVWLGRVTTARLPLLRLFCLISALLAAVAIGRYATDPLEWDFTKLRAQDTPGEQIGRRLAQVGIGDIGINRALRTFGLMAAAGELCCLLAALVVVPVLLHGARPQPR